MPNTKQNNEIEHINKEIILLQDRHKKNEKSLNQFQNGLILPIWKNTSKQRTKYESFLNQKNTKYSLEYISK